MSPRAHPCSLHRAALLDFVDRGERSGATPAAFDHLDGCPACRHELESIALTVAALRRLGADAATHDVSPAAWARLRRRLERPPVSRAQVRATLGALATSAALVGVLVGVHASRPAALGQASDLAPILRADDIRAATASVAERRLLDHSGQAVPRDPVPLVAPDAATRWTGPDGRGITLPGAPKSASIERVK